MNQDARNDRALDRLKELFSASADQSWQAKAMCAQTDPDAFFPEKGGSTKDAKAICLGCDVRAECLAYALNNDERFGIWGGMSERERRKLNRHYGVTRTSITPTTGPKCGTPNGVKSHANRGERACNPCLRAARAAGAA